MSELWVITSFFNPSAYKTKERNYQLFRDGLRARGIQLLTVECSFDGQFELTDGPVIRVGARDPMWQKERLLNLAIQRLPETCDKLVWADCDVLFENPDWATETHQLLESHALVQPFSEAVRLPQGAVSQTDGEEETAPSFCSVFAKDALRCRSGKFDAHGHTGYAWAVRRDVIQSVGLYDAAVAGSADHFMAHAALGDWDSPCVTRLLGQDSAHREHFETWARKFSDAVQNRVGVVPGRLLHLWHGDTAKRSYMGRHTDLANLGFDPSRDLEPGDEGAWNWASGRSDLADWARRYFESRDEDGHGNSSTNV